MESNSLNNKTLWEMYGKYAILGLVLVCAAVGGWQYWGHKKEQNLIEASKQYDMMMKAFSSKDLRQTSSIAQELIDNYEGTPYAAFAALMQGRLMVEQNELAKASEYFNDAIELGDDGPISHVARLRLARVLTAEQKLDEALKVLLSSTENEGYVALYEEAKGDIYVQQKHFDKAREAYKAAEQALPPGVQVMALQLKQNDIMQDVGLIKTTVNSQDTAKLDKDGKLEKAAMVEKNGKDEKAAGLVKNDKDEKESKDGKSEKTGQETNTNNMNTREGT